MRGNRAGESCGDSMGVKRRLSKGEDRTSVSSTQANVRWVWQTTCLSNAEKMPTGESQTNCLN